MMKVCPKCNSWTTDENAKFCRHDGTALEDIGTYCAKCNTYIYKTDNYCSHCGEKIQ